METLGDVAEKVPSADEPAMETVRLEGGNMFNADDPPKPNSFVVCLSAARRNLFVTGDNSHFIKILHSVNQ